MSDISRQIRQPINKVNQKEAEKFMSSSSNQMGAEYLLNQKAQSKDWTRQEFIDNAKRFGYLKTNKDANIVEHIIQKNKIKDNSDIDRKNKIQKIKEKIADNYVKQFIKITRDPRELEKF